MDVDRERPCAQTTTITAEPYGIYAVGLDDQRAVHAHKRCGRAWWTRRRSIWTNLLTEC